MLTTMQQYAPGNSPWVDLRTGKLTPAAHVFLRTMWMRNGGTVALTNDELQALISALDTRVDALEATVQPATTATVDFGSTPTAEGSFVITDTDCTAASTVNVLVSGSDTTATNDAEAHQLASTFFCFAAIPAAGSFTLKVHTLFGFVTGQFKVRYSLG